MSARAERARTRVAYRRNLVQWITREAEKYKASGDGSAENALLRVAMLISEAQTFETSETRDLDAAAMRARHIERRIAGAMKERERIAEWLRACALTIEEQANDEDALRLCATLADILEAPPPFAYKIAAEQDLPPPPDLFSDGPTSADAATSEVDDGA